MAEPIKISELPIVGDVSTSAMFPMSQTGANGLSTYKATAADLSKALMSDFVYSDLETESKNAIGAINEIDSKFITTKADLTKLDSDVELLYKITQGQIWDFVDQQESGTNLAPKGTERQSLISVDGKSEQVTTAGYQLSSLYALRTNDAGAINLASGTLGTVVNGENYVLSFENNTPLNDSVSLRIYNGTEQVRVTNFALTPNAKTVVSFTALSSGDVMLNKAMDVQYANQDVFTEIMLEKGSTAHDFEPYTGGVPSPTPAYPQPITSVEQLNFKVVTGKNLFDLNDFGNKYITVGSSIVGRYPVYVGVGKTVTLSTDYRRKNGFTSIFLLTSADDTATSALGAYNEHPRTVTAISDYVWVGLYYNATQDYQTTYQQLIEQGIHIQLEYGDSATAYEPYREEIHTITPPHALNKVGDVADVADVVKGTWNTNIKTITEADFAHSIEREQSYFLLAEPVETPIDTADLEYLKSLQNLDSDNVITITDQNNNNISYLMKYLIKLSEAI